MFVLWTLKNDQKYINQWSKDQTNNGLKWFNRLLI